MWGIGLGPHRIRRPELDGVMTCRCKPLDGIQRGQRDVVSSSRVWGRSSAAIVAVAVAGTDAVLLVSPSPLLFSLSSLFLSADLPRCF